MQIIHPDSSAPDSGGWLASVDLWVFEHQGNQAQPSCSEPKPFNLLIIYWPSGLPKHEGSVALKQVAFCQVAALLCDGPLQGHIAVAAIWQG